MRFVDLHNEWLQQYAGETCMFDAATAELVSQRLRRLEGYLTDTSLAVLVCSRSAADWQSREDPWSALAELVARYEAEFSGRLLLSPSDLALYRSEPADALTWGVLAVSGFDFLVRELADLDRLPSLYRRGARVFRMVSAGESLLGGCDQGGDDRGLTALGYAWLERLAQVSIDHAPRSRPVIDLAGQNVRTMTEVFDWVEADASRAELVILMHGQGIGRFLASPGPEPGVEACLVRLQAAGGLVAIDPDASAWGSSERLFEKIQWLMATAPHSATRGQGIALSTNYLGLERVMPGFDNVERLMRWVKQSFDDDTARKLIGGNGNELVDRMLGVTA